MEEHRPLTKEIEARSQPNRYLIHKYWGRKPAHLIAEFIHAYTCALMVASASTTEACGEAHE